jgi:hypothetical protein
VHSADIIQIMNFGSPNPFGAPATTGAPTPAFTFGAAPSTAAPSVGFSFGAAPKGEYYICSLLPDTWVSKR